MGGKRSLVSKKEAFSPPIADGARFTTQRGPPQCTVRLIFVTRKRKISEGDKRVSVGITHPLRTIPHRRILNAGQKATRHEPEILSRSYAGAASS